MPAPKAVLLDVGGIFHLPEPERIVGAFARAQVTISPDVLDNATTQRGAVGVDLGEIDWKS
jgi:hypothetical protein